MMLSLLADTTAPTRLIDVVKMPILLSILGLIIWGAGVAIQNKFEAKQVKFLGFLPILIGFFIGAAQLKMLLTDAVYQEMTSQEGGKTIPGHYMAVIIPIICAGIMGYWFMRLKQSERETLDRF